MAEEKNHGKMAEITERETLNLVNDQRQAFRIMWTKTGGYWRVYKFIEGATCYDAVKNDDDFYQSAVAFGHFQRLLADYPAETLHETIPNFHNTPDRMRIFREAVQRDVMWTGQQVFRKKSVL